MHLVAGNKILMQIFSGFLRARFSKNEKELCLWEGFGTKRLVYVMNASCSYQGQCGDHRIALRGLKHSHNERRKRYSSVMIYYVMESYLQLFPKKWLNSFYIDS